MSQRIDFSTVAPNGMRALGGVGAYIAQSGLTPELVELVYQRVSLINGCAFCLDMHTRELRKHGVAEEKITLTPVWREAEALFTAKERAALGWAEAVTRLGEHGVSDAAYSAVAEEFTEKEIVDLTITVGLMNAYNRLAISLRATPQSAKLPHSV